MKKVDKDLKPSLSADPPRMFSPASPLLDEGAILAQLAIKLDVAHTNQPTQSAAIMGIVDAYDRKLPRGPFLQIVSRAINLHDRIRQVSMLMSMRMELAAEDHKREEVVARLDKFMEKKYEEAEEFRIGLYRDLSYIDQMAWEGDAIN